MAKLDRATVLQAAAELANTEGLKSLSLKNLAEKLGVRSPSLFKHIQGLEDLHTALMLYGWKQLGDCVIMSAVGKAGDNAARAMCKAYYDYAKANPGIFESMMWINQNSSPEAQQATIQLAKLVALVLESYQLDEQAQIHASRMIRSFLQGFSSIVNNGSFVDPVPVDESFYYGVDLLIAGIKSKKAKGM